MSILDTAPWTPMQNIIPGAVVAVFSNIACQAGGAAWYWRILVPVILSAGYELWRAIQGDNPLTGNVIYAGLGAAAFTSLFMVGGFVLKTLL